MSLKKEEEKVSGGMEKEKRGLPSKQGCAMQTLKHTVDRSVGVVVRERFIQV